MLLHRLFTPRVAVLLLGLLSANCVTVAGQVSCAGAGQQGDCTEIGREICDPQQSTPDTCGPCLDGFTGDPGFGNTQCQRVSCGVPPTIANAVAEQPDQIIVSGQLAPFLCSTGYNVEGMGAEDKAFRVLCDNDGTFVQTPPCVDTDGCASEPCGEHDCQDVPAPETGFRCKCSNGQFGDPNVACFQVSMETNDSGELVATASDLLVHVAGSGSPVRVGTDITSLKLDLSVLSTMVTQTTLDLETDLLALNASINDAKSSVTDSSERTDGFINDLNTATSVLRTDVDGLVTKTDGIVRDAMAKTVELDDLRTFVLELAENHTDLNDHVTLNVSTLLSEALEAEELRSKQKDSEHDSKLNDHASRITILEGLNQQVAALDTRITDQKTTFDGQLGDVISLLAAQKTALDAALLTIEELQKPQYTSCLHLHRAEPTKPSGLYTIYPLHFPSLEVYCDMTTEGGGWTRTTWIKEPTQNSAVIEETSQMITHGSLEHRSFAGVWYTTQRPSAMYIEAINGGGSNCGNGDKVMIQWDDSPFELYNYNNHKLKLCKHLTNNHVYPNCQYAAHAGNPWQFGSFSFTSNNVNNGYTSNSDNRINLGPTSRPGFNCYWHSFGGDQIPINRMNRYDSCPQKQGYVYFR